MSDDLKENIMSEDGGRQMPKEITISGALTENLIRPPLDAPVNNWESAQVQAPIENGVIDITLKLAELGKNGPLTAEQKREKDRLQALRKTLVRSTFTESGQLDLDMVTRVMPEVIKSASSLSEARELLRQSGGRLDVSLRRALHEYSSRPEAHGSASAVFNDIAKFLEAISWAQSPAGQAVTQEDRERYIDNVYTGMVFTPTELGIDDDLRELWERTTNPSQQQAGQRGSQTTQAHGQRNQPQAARDQRAQGQSTQQAPRPSAQSDQRGPQTPPQEQTRAQTPVDESQLSPYERAMLTEARQQRELLAAQKLLAEEQVRGMRREESRESEKGGFRALIAALDQRSGVRKGDWLIEGRPWFEQLPDVWKEALGTWFDISNISAVKRGGDIDTLFTNQQMKELNVRGGDVDKALRYIPGVNMALATMIYELFDMNEGTFKLTQEGREKLQHSSVYLNNLRLRIQAEFSDPQKWEQYKQKLAIPTSLNLNPELAAKAGVMYARDLLYMACEVESGDINEVDYQKRVDNNFMMTGPVRSLMLPFLQGLKKWTGGGGGEFDFEEGWGGPIGAWYADRSANDPSFKKNLYRGTPALFPHRLIYGMFEQVKFPKGSGAGELEDKTIASQLLNIKLMRQIVPRTQTESGLVQYSLDPEPVGEQGSRSLRLDLLNSHDLWGTYRDQVETVISINDMLQGKGPDKKRKLVDLPVMLVRFRKDAQLKEYYAGRNGEDLILGCIAGQSGGLVLGTSELVLVAQRPEEETYDYYLEGVLADDRLYAGLDKGAKDRLKKRLHYSPPGVWGERGREERKQILRKAANSKRKN